MVVERRLAALPEANPLCEEHERVSTMLLEEVSRAAPRPDARRITGLVQIRVTWQPVRTLNALKDGLTGDVIQQFKATQGLEEIEATGQQSATFLLQVFLRGTTAAEVHEGLLSLAHNSLTHLVGISIKRQSPTRSQLANQLAALTFGS